MRNERHPSAPRINPLLLLMVATLAVSGIVYKQSILDWVGLHLPQNQGNQFAGKSLKEIDQMIQGCFVQNFPTAVTGPFVSNFVPGYVVRLPEGREKLIYADLLGASFASLDDKATKLAIEKGIREKGVSQGIFTVDRPFAAVRRSVDVTDPFHVKNEVIALEHGQNVPVGYYLNSLLGIPTFGGVSELIGVRMVPTADTWRWDCGQMNPAEVATILVTYNWANRMQGVIDGVIER